MVQAQEDFLLQMMPAKHGDPNQLVIFFAGAMLVVVMGLVLVNYFRKIRRIGGFQGKAETTGLLTAEDSMKVDSR